MLRHGISDLVACQRADAYAVAPAGAEGTCPNGAGSTIAYMAKDTRAVACCFCAQTLPLTEAWSIHITKAVPDPRNRDGFQHLWAHARCIIAALPSDMDVMPQLVQAAHLPES